MNEREFAELAAGYALNALSPADLELFESTLAARPEWSAILDEDTATAAALGEGIVEAVPPRALRASLLSQIATTPQNEDSAIGVEAEPSADARRSSVPAGDSVRERTSAYGVSSEGDSASDENVPPRNARRSWAKTLFALAASLVVLVTLGFGAVNLLQWTSRTPAVVALEEVENAPDAQSASTVLDGGGTATAHWSEEIGKVVLVADGLPSISGEETFELWFVRKDGNAVSAGTFDATSSAATALLTGSLESGDSIAVTVERSGGSPTGAPSTSPIVVIPTV